MKYTPNYELKKPEQDDFYNVEDFNENADIIDQALYALEADLADLQEEVNAHLAGNQYAWAQGVNDLVITTGGDFQYADGAVIRFGASNTNTGAVTLNVDGKGVRPLRNPATYAELPPGRLEQYQYYEAIYNGSHDCFFIKTNVEFDAHKNDKVAHIDYAVASGTNAYTANIQGITALVEGLSVKIKFQNANTEASTLSINGLDAKPIQKSNGTALSGGNIKAGQICHLVYTGSVFQLLGEGGEYGNVTPDKVLEGTTFGTENGVATGNIPIAPTYPFENTASGFDVYSAPPNPEYGNHNVFMKIPKGYYDETWVGVLEPNLKASNLKHNVVIGSGSSPVGIVGSYDSDADGTAANLLANKVLYGKGQRIVGTMPDRGAVTNTITTQGGTYTIPQGYHNGSGKVTANFANLVAENIKKGVNIGGVVGTMNPSQFATGTTEYMYVAKNGPTGPVSTTISLSFTPKLFIAYGDSVTWTGAVTYTVDTRPMCIYYDGNRVVWSSGLLFVNQEGCRDYVNLAWESSTNTIWLSLNAYNSCSYGSPITWYAFA